MDYNKIISIKRVHMKQCYFRCKTRFKILVTRCKTRSSHMSKVMSSRGNLAQRYLWAIGAIIHQSSHISNTTMIVTSKPSNQQWNQHTSETTPPRVSNQPSINMTPSIRETKINSQMYRRLNSSNLRPRIEFKSRTNNLTLNVSFSKNRYDS